MTASQKKLVRTQRIAALETTRLNALIADVVRIDAQINARHKRMGELREVRDREFSSGRSLTVEMLSQNRVWMDGIDRTIAAIEDEVQTLHQDRSHAQQHVMEQRSRVKGLETLIESLRFDVDSEAATEQMLIADEKALNDYAG